MRLMLSALECDIDTSPRLPSNAAGIYIKTSLNGGCVVTLYISNKGHELNKMFTIPLISSVKTIQICQPGIKKPESSRFCCIIAFWPDVVFHLALFRQWMSFRCFPEMFPLDAFMQLNLWGWLTCFATVSRVGFDSEMEIKTRAGSV